jgi:hypothetical protein
MAGMDSAEVLASKILRKVEVQERLAELSRPAERKAKLDAAALIDEWAARSSSYPSGPAAAAR